jgi:hypothetical protein
VVLDCTDARQLAEFYRQLLGLSYRPGDDPRREITDGTKDKDWLVLRDSTGRNRLAFQQVDDLTRTTWPENSIPQQLHLDMTVPTYEALEAQRRRATDLGARLIYDRSEDPLEPLHVYADPAGHPFCIFVVTESMTSSE